MTTETQSVWVCSHGVATPQTCFVLKAFQLRNDCTCWGCRWKNVTLGWKRALVDRSRRSATHSRRHKLIKPYKWMCQLVRFPWNNNPGCCELQIHQAVSFCTGSRELGGLWPAGHLLKVHTAAHSLKPLCLGGWSITGRSYTLPSCCWTMMDVKFWLRSCNWQQGIIVAAAAFVWQHENLCPVLLQGATQESSTCSFFKAAEALKS